MSTNVRARVISRERLGAMMHHWHSSAGDPLYAVGSYYSSGKAYPKKSVVKSALSEAEALEPRARAGQHGMAPEGRRRAPQHHRRTSLLLARRLRRARSSQPRQAEAEQVRQAPPMPAEPAPALAPGRVRRNATRNYEYVVYPEPRVAGEGYKIIPSTLVNEKPAIAYAKRHPGSGIYSVTKGRFIGWVNFNGRFVRFGRKS